MNQSRLRFLVTAWPLAVVLALAGCAPGAAAIEPRSLAGTWAFKPGDDPSWAARDFDDSRWVRLQVPGSWRRQGFGGITGDAWYRLRVPAPGPPGAMLGVTLGKIDSAYRLYVGGQSLGGVGALPPNPRMEYDRHRTYSIPAEALEPDGSLVLALHVWRDPRKRSTSAGPVEGPFEVGPIARLIEREKLSEAQELALILLFGLVALSHLTLRLQLGRGADYTWFAVLTLLATVYLFLRTQWKYAMLDDFLVLKKIEHIVLWFVPAAILQFLWVFFHQQRPPWLWLMQALLAAGALTVFAAPGLIVALAILPLLQLTVVPLLIVSLWLVVRRIAVGDREARFIGFGIAVLGATIVHDALVDRSYLVQPRVSTYGFTILVAGMSVTMGTRFQRALRDRDALLHDLESRVDMRTRDLSEAYEAMENMALYDGLTNVMNRRAIRDRAGNELARARRHKTPLTIALIDIDHFKNINDTHGHAAGDQVLIQLAQRLARGARASDEIGRWGGEEFLVLMPGTDRAEAAVAGERLRSLGAVSSITVSVGLAVVDARMAGPPDLDTLIRHADEALYQAKAGGRNLVRVSGV